jgi:hypothetical protein
MELEAVTKLNEELRLAQEGGLQVMSFPPLMGGFGLGLEGKKPLVEIRIRLYDQVDYL